MTPFPRPRRVACATALLLLGACGENGFDLDLRDNLGNAFDTSSAVMEVRTSDRPRPDNRGLISYPGYQVAVARQDDTVDKVAGRVGLSVNELAQYNGMNPGQPLRRGEIIALPRRVAEPSPATGATVTGPIRPAQSAVTAPEAIAVAPLDSGPVLAAAPVAAPEPVRHKVARGESAIIIARRYGIPLKALADWNGLSGEMTVRIGQYLLIPPALPGSAPRTDTANRPGSGTVAPLPPSATQPLPDKNETAGTPKETPPSPGLKSSQSKTASAGRFAVPVAGPIIRTFKKGKSDGIDISASPGSPVMAADAGTVAAITRDTDQIPILVIRHAGNLLTVYAGVDQISVRKGDQVKRGQVVAKVRAAPAPGLHFEVREGFDSVDPEPYLK